MRRRHPIGHTHGMCAKAVISVNFCLFAQASPMPSPVGIFARSSDAFVQLFGVVGFEAQRVMGPNWTALTAFLCSLLRVKTRERMGVRGFTK